MARGKAEKGDDSAHESGLRAAVDPTTEDGRAFFQARVSLFGKWFFALAFSFYILQNFPLDVLMGARTLDWIEEWFGFKERLQLGVVTLAAAMWLSTRGRALSPGALRGIDASGLVISCALISAMLLEEALVEGQVFQVFVVLLASTNLVTVRAIVIPSTVRRTLVVSSLAFASVFVAVAFSMTSNTGFSQVKTAHIVIAALMWGAIATASAALTSRILFLLRSQVSRATKLGHYVLEEKIGQGGMGAVYRASHATLRRPTAIKLLSPDRNQEVDLRRFEREVQWTARLKHPNTVEIYDYGRTPSGIFYCAMEFIDGLTLQQLVDEQGALPPSRVIRILSQICGALAEAHADGIIHRDVKPANIMLCNRAGVPDMVKVLDFGLVKELATDAEEAELSAIGVVVGTPAYLSPEAIEDPASVDARSDLYALGAVGYFLLTGKQIYEGKSVVSTCVQHLSSEPVRPSDRLGAPLPSDIEELVLQCLAKNPADRPRDAMALAEALTKCGCAAEWTDEQARSWWLEHQAASKERPPEKIFLQNTVTMSIDLSRRTAGDSGEDKRSTAG